MQASTRIYRCSPGFLDSPSSLLQSPVFRYRGFYGPECARGAPPLTLARVLYASSSATSESSTDREVGSLVFHSHPSTANATRRWMCLRHTHDGGWRSGGEKSRMPMGMEKYIGFCGCRGEITNAFVCTVFPPLMLYAYMI